MKLLLTPLPHASPSPPDFLFPHSLSPLFYLLHHPYVFKAVSSSFERLGTEGRGDEIEGESLKTRRSRCAARQRCQTAEHDRHKERVIAAATCLVGRITAFSEIYCMCASTVRARTLSPVGVREVHNRAHRL